VPGRGARGGVTPGSDTPRPAGKEGGDDDGDDDDDDDDDDHDDDDANDEDDDDDDDDCPLQGNAMGTEGVCRLASALGREGVGDRILHLDLSNNGITDLGADRLARSLHPPRLPRLQTLNLNSNPILPAGAEALARCFGAGGGRELQRLLLDRTNIG
jgi:hypothetical protein